MPRILGCEKNLLVLEDRLSGGELGVYYRMPTTKERVKYSNECFPRKGKKVVNNTVQTRQKWGRIILTGLRDGDWEDWKDGKNVPMSSDSASEHYNPDWKEKTCEHAMDVVEMLAATVFDVSVTSKDNEDTTQDDDGEDEEDDLTKK